MHITTIGLDLAKHWFQIHGIGAAGIPLKNSQSHRFSAPVRLVGGAWFERFGLFCPFQLTAGGTRVPGSEFSPRPTKLRRTCTQNDEARSIYCNVQ